VNFWSIRQGVEEGIIRGEQKTMNNENMVQPRMSKSSNQLKTVIANGMKLFVLFLL